VSLVLNTDMIVLNTIFVEMTQKMCYSDKRYSERERIVPFSNFFLMNLVIAISGSTWLI